MSFLGEAGGSGSDALAAPGTPGSRLQFPAGGGARPPEATEAGSGGRAEVGPEMAPPAGGAAASSDPGSPAVLLAVHAAVRPLGAGPDAEAQLRRLQLSADPERPGRFRLELLGAGHGAVSGSSRGAAGARSFRSPAAPGSGFFPCFCLLARRLEVTLVPPFIGRLRRFHKIIRVKGLGQCQWSTHVTSCSFDHLAVCAGGEALSPDSPPPQVGLEWPLESVYYTVRGPSQHELQPPPGGPGTLGLHFTDPQEAQRWAALVRSATMEGQNGQCPGSKIHLIGQRLCQC